MEKTVLVLGAGFSMPYGYPSGETLVERIISSYSGGGSRWDLRELANALADVAPYSIDRFLSERPDLLNAGIEAIVRQLSIAERDSLSHSVDPSQDIIKLLVNELGEDQFSKLTILTFNYDRLLEWRLLRRIRRLKSSDAEALEVFSNLAIEHLHGRMLNLPIERSPSNADPYAEYGSFGGMSSGIETAIAVGIKNFKTVYTNDDQPNLAAIRALKLARRVFFLGFGFEPLNMRKLGIGVHGVNFHWRSKVVAGTCFGVKKISQNRITQDYPFLNERLFDINAKSFFQSHFSLIDPTNDATPIKFEHLSCCEISAHQERKNQNRSELIGYYEDIRCLECGKESTVHYHRQNSSAPWLVQLR